MKGKIEGLSKEMRDTKDKISIMELKKYNA